MFVLFVFCDVYLLWFLVLLVFFNVVDVFYLNIVWLMFLFVV